MQIEELIEKINTGGSEPQASQIGIVDRISALIIDSSPTSGSIRIPKYSGFTVMANYRENFKEVREDLGKYLKGVEKSQSTPAAIELWRRFVRAPKEKPSISDLLKKQTDYLDTMNAGIYRTIDDAKGVMENLYGQWFDSEDKRHNSQQSLDKLEEIALDKSNLYEAVKSRIEKMTLKDKGYHELTKGYKNLEIDLRDLRLEMINERQSVTYCTTDMQQIRSLEKFIYSVLETETGAATQISQSADFIRTKIPIFAYAESQMGRFEEVQVALGEAIGYMDRVLDITGKTLALAGGTSFEIFKSRKFMSSVGGKIQPYFADIQKASETYINTVNMDAQRILTTPGVDFT